jgi:hypothetical protein
MGSLMNSMDAGIEQELIEHLFLQQVIQMATFYRIFKKMTGDSIRQGEFVLGVKHVILQQQTITS